MHEPDPGVLRAEFLKIVKNQIRASTPPETKQTYERLIAEGHSHDETMKMLACVVVSEIFDVLKQNKPYNEARYIAALNALPELPWDDED